MSMAMDESSSSKRRKISPHNLHISNLQDWALVDIAKYLPKASCALFAVALTAPPASWERTKWQLGPSVSSDAVVSAFAGDWDEIDFEDVDGDVAAKLTDGDVGGVLRCAHSLRCLRSLRLTGCINITGRGLRPLICSRKIERLDLSLVGRNESPGLDPEPLLSEKSVSPILLSILLIRIGDRRVKFRSRLKHVQLPKKFLVKETNERLKCSIGDFLKPYNQLLELRNSRCAICEVAVDLRVWRERNIRVSPIVVHKRGVEDFGRQRYTCYECTKFFPPENFCNCSFGGCSYLDNCFICEKYFCQDCVRMDECVSCERKSCQNCEALVNCAFCLDMVCERCAEECATCHHITCGCVTYHRCYGDECEKEHCEHCRDHDRENCDVQRCNQCDGDFCQDCRYRECKKDWKDACHECVELIQLVIGPRMAKENQMLHQENKRLVGENRKLRRETRLRRLLE